MRSSPFCFALCLTLSTATARAQQIKPVVVIGGENDRAVAIGVIQDAAVLPRLLVILEGASPFVRVFDHSGKLLQTLGRDGSGPGEFRFPVAVTYDSARHEVLVTDRYPARITRYAVTDSLAFRDVITSSVTELHGTCAIGGRLYTLGSFGEGIVHEISRDAASIKPIRSLGSLKTTHPQGENPVFRFHVPQGRMFCEESQGRIYVMNGLGDLHTIDVISGSSNVARVTGFITTNVSANDRGGITVAWPETGYWHNVLGFIREPEGLVMVVGTRKPTGQTAPRSAIVSYATLPLPLRTPAALMAPRAWQPLGRIANMSICAIQDPYPTIGYFQQPRCP
jgi:hypothetical protein